MAVALTEYQQGILKSLMNICGHFADQILYIMKNHGLDKIDGSRLTIMVDPKCLFTTESVSFGSGLEHDSGYVLITKGRRMKNEPFVPTGTNSAEYELLFADETVRQAILAGKKTEKPLPPDGLWVGADRNNDPVDGWEWDMNDSLS